jgi:hypothetical protein
MDNNALLNRLAGGFGCDLVTGTAEFTARKGRIWKLVSNAADSRILNMTEEYPLSTTNRKRVVLVNLTGTKGTATVVCNGVSRTATFSNSLTVTASNFVSANGAAYLAAGVVLTSSGPVLIFTAVTAGVEFIADTTITNATTDLAGTVYATYIKNTATVTGRSYMSVKRVDTITLAGTSGSCTIIVDGVTKTCTWNAGGLTATAAAFVTANAADYLAAGTVLTSVGAVLYFTAVEAGTDFTGASSGANASGDLAGTAATPTANSVVAINDTKEIIPDYPLTKFTPAKGSFMVYYGYE